MNKIKSTILLMMLTTNLIGCQSTQPEDMVEPIVTTTNAQENVNVNVSEDVIDMQENENENVSESDDDIPFTEDIIENESQSMSYTDLPLYEEMNDLMHEDMQKLTIIPQEFLDYCENNSVQIKTEELEMPIGVKQTHYIIVKDGVETGIGGILDLTNDTPEILYHNTKNAESLRTMRSLETGEFTEGYMLLGRIISVSRDNEGNIESIDISNEKLNQMYVDKTLELHEYYKEQY